MIPELVNQRFVDFRDAVVNNGILESKTIFMVQMAAAMAVGCYP